MLNSALSYTFLLVSVSSHMHMTRPLPQWLDAFMYDKNAPSQKCTLVQADQGNPINVVGKFNERVAAAGYGTIKDYVDACAVASGTQQCGNTIKGAKVGFSPSFTIEIGADHIGPSEIWVDGQRVMYNPGLENGQLKKTPANTPADLGSLCKSGNCMVRFVMAALHNYPVEIYDNCVTISNGSPGTPPSPPPPPAAPQITAPQPAASNPSSRNDPQAAAVSEQQASDKKTIEPSKIPGNPNKEWSCSTDLSKLIRTVGSFVYEIPCAAGTVCTDRAAYALCDYPSK